MAAFQGAKVEARWDTTWFEPAQETPVAHLRLGLIEDNPWWLRVQELTRRAVERWTGQVSVGFTDLGGNLDILASLRTTSGLLFDLLDAPDEVARATAAVTPLWQRYYDTLHALIQRSGCGTTPWAPIWSPRRCYMLQSDFAYMISPRMFERFVLPDLAACCETLDAGFYHLDGKGQIPHLDMLLSLERLRGIQWIPGDGAPPPEEWLPLLRRIRAGGKLCQLFTTAEGALTIARALGGKGFAFFIFEEDAQNMTDGEIADYLATMRRTG
jgi:5-methyltetrahydrofolate--homocysteine methyltransferase